MCMLWNAVIRRKYNAELNFTTQELYTLFRYIQWTLLIAFCHYCNDWKIIPLSACQGAVLLLGEYK